MTRTLTLLAPLAGAAAAALVAVAPRTAEAQALGDWSFQITPYVWFEGINGDITPGTGAPPLEIDASFSDILEDLNSAFFLHGLARSGDFVLFFDLSTSSSSRGGLIPPGIPAEGSLSQTSLTLAGGYRVVDNPQGHFDLLAGARAWWIEAEVDVPAA
ncbi:MAG: hypothetical protein JJT81_17910, partial [Rubellimicrobium sp.]|nr:hypothetical protein [Rubellimicrobium sp.]